MICPIAADNSEVTPKSNKPAVANTIASLNRPMSLPICRGFVRFSTNNGRTGNSNHPDKRILTERHRETPKVAGAFQYFTIKYICLFAFLHAIIICQLPSNVKLFPVFPADFPGFTFRAVFE